MAENVLGKSLLKGISETNISEYRKIMKQAQIKMVDSFLPPSEESFTGKVRINELIPSANYKIVDGSLVEGFIARGELITASKNNDFISVVNKYNNSDGTVEWGCLYHATLISVHDQAHTIDMDLKYFADAIEKAAGLFYINK